MTIEIATHTLIGLDELQQRLPRRNGRVAVALSVIYRWAKVGCMAPGGQRVKLPVLKIGGRLCTSIEACQHFFCQLSEPNEAEGGGHA